MVSLFLSRKDKEIIKGLVFEYVSFPTQVYVENNAGLFENRLINTICHFPLNKKKISERQAIRIIKEMIKSGELIHEKPEIMGAFPASLEYYRLPTLKEKILNKRNK